MFWRAFGVEGGNRGVKTAPENQRVAGGSDPFGQNFLWNLSGGFPDGRMAFGEREPGI